MREKIIEASKFVVEKARDVRINRTKIKEFEKLMYTYSPYIEHQNELFPKERRIEFFILLSALNFKFWEKEGNYIQKNINEFNGKKYMGYYGLAACLRKAISKGIPLYDPTYLSKISLEEAHKVFSDNIRMPMLETRVNILHELGERGENLNAFIKRSELELSSLVQELVRTYPSFNDVSKYENREIPFYKRAQYLFQMLHVLGALRIKNIGKITVPADYRLPQALRELGILRYSKELANKIDNHKLILADSTEEVEIRASTIYACELIAKRFNLPIIRVDNILWRFSRDKVSKPHHLTETTAY